MIEAIAQRARYRILRPIGSGGMGQVFEAFDERLRRTVALKVLHPHLAADPEARARFAREAQATARLRHPNIVEIFDVAGLDAEDAFIVTELIRGMTLREFAAAHRFAPPSELALLVMHQLAGALAHAHAHGVVHRDLKPENVMLSASGVLKLMDFGIARILDSEMRMTMTGALVGSPLHMAPEIVEGERATPASDVFSAGTILYWLACGVPPFQGNNASQTLKKILDGARPDPRLSAPFLSERQCALIDRCLDRDPARRFADGGALYSAIEELLAEEGLGDPAAGLGAFIARPEAARGALTAQLAARWIGQGEAALAQSPPNVALAIERLDRALSIAPENAAALVLDARVRSLRQVARRRARWRRGALGAGILIGMGALLAWGALCARPALDAGATALAEGDLSPGRAPGERAAQSVDTAIMAAAQPAAPAQEAGVRMAAIPAAPPRAPHAPLGSAGTAERARRREIPDKKPRRSRAAEMAAAAVAAREGEGQGTPPPAEHRRSAPADPTPPRAALGRLEVMVQHASHGLTWGKIFVDGQWVNGQSPAWSGEIPVGRHELRVEAPCCLAEVRSVDVAPGEQNPPVVFRLLSRPALLSVVSDEACEIWLDGLRRASCADSVRDPVAVPLPKGALRSDVTFLLVRPGKGDLARTEHFEAGQARKVRVRFAADD